MNTEQLQTELLQFHGTETYHRHVLNPQLVWTDGVLHFARQAKAFWFIDAIAVGVNGNPGPVPNVVPRQDEFAIVVLDVRQIVHTVEHIDHHSGATEDIQVNGSRIAILSLYSDTDEYGYLTPDYLLYEESTAYTDCPTGVWKFYLERSGNYVVLMLPGER